jgi:hypothetical protein
VRKRRWAQSRLPCAERRRSLDGGRAAGAAPALAQPRARDSFRAGLTLGGLVAAEGGEPLVERGLLRVLLRLLLPLLALALHLELQRVQLVLQLAARAHDVEAALVQRRLLLRRRRRRLVVRHRRARGERRENKAGVEESLEGRSKGLLLVTEE